MITRIGLVVSVICISIIFNAGNIHAQAVSILKDSITDLCSEQKGRLLLDGEVYKNKKYFKYCAILIRDTCVSINRFDECTISRNINCQSGPYYSALLIDTNKVKLIEKLLYENFDLISKQVPDLIGRNTLVFSSYVRVYGGFYDKEGNKTIALQLITHREFKVDKTYKRWFNLFSLRRNGSLRVLFIKYKNDGVHIFSLNSTLEIFVSMPPGT